MHFSRRKFLQATLASWVACVAIKANASPADDELLVDRRKRLAVADMRLASEWMAHSYEIPARVPQEMLLGGHTYADTLIALALMSKGASLNELMEQRAYHRWDVITKKVELDAQALPDVIRQLMPSTRLRSPVPVLHYLPDVYLGQARDLSFNAFTPVVPGRSLMERFKLDDDEVENIRKALDDPLGVPDQLLLETGGKGGLVVGDWVIAGVLTHHRPLGIDTVLSCRSGERLSWSETCLAFGMRPDVLTRGPLSGIYPILSGSAPGTILCARRRTQFPPDLGLDYDLERLTADERRAIMPLMARCYNLTSEELRLLDQNKAGLAEKGLMAALSRLGKVDLPTILDLHRAGNNYRGIVSRFALDLTGQDGVKAVIDAREPLAVDS